MRLALQCQQVLSDLLHKLHFKATSMLLWPYSQCACLAAVAALSAFTDATSQGCTKLQSLIKCLDREISIT